MSDGWALAAIFPVVNPRGPPSSAIRPYDDTTLRRRLIGKVFSDILLPCAPWPYHPVSAESFIARIQRDLTVGHANGRFADLAQWV